MQFAISSISASIWLSPQHCDDVRRWQTRARPISRMRMSAEESEAKQLAYQRQRAKWLKEIGIKAT
jgi:hypothetical protein